jgi:DNA-directed RNA polymerase subunit K
MKYTKYEIARIIGSRALQISMGAPIMVKLEKEDLEKMRYSTLEIAKLEFERDLVPITVKRMPPRRTDTMEKPIPRRPIPKLGEELAGKKDIDELDLAEPEDTDSEKEGFD